MLMMSPAWIMAFGSRDVCTPDLTQHTMSMFEELKNTFTLLNMNKTGVERRQTLGPLRSVNPNMINYFIKQLPLLFFKSYTCCLDMNL